MLTSRAGLAGRVAGRKFLSPSVLGFGIMTTRAESFRLQSSDCCEWCIDLPIDPYGDGYVRRAGVEIRADGLTAHCGDH